MTTEAPLDPEQAAQILRFNRTFFDLLSPAMRNYAADPDVRDLVASAENFIDALERVDDDQTLAAAETARWKIGCSLSDSDTDGMRALGIFMLIDICAEHPELTGPLITRLARRLETALLDERPAAQLEAHQ